MIAFHADRRSRNEVLDETMRDTRQRQPWFAVPLLIVLLPLIVVVMTVWCVAAISVLVAVWTTWCPRGRYALVVYSNSPIWQQYFDEQVLPAIGNRSVVLNWSDRKRWKISLSVASFRMFAGDHDFNPMVIVFPPFRWPRRFRFYEAFRTFKHGRHESVERIRTDLLGLLDQLCPPSRG
jgi:hypothetical protein